jgi:hypothetical protein
MGHNDLEAARRHHAALKRLIERHTGDAADLRALRRAVDLCRGAADAVEDAYCHEKVRLAAEYAAELFAYGERTRGVEYLKRQALTMLELFESRLYRLALNPRSF